MRLAVRAAWLGSPCWCALLLPRTTSSTARTRRTRRPAIVHRVPLWRVAGMPASDVVIGGGW